MRFTRLLAVLASLAFGQAAFAGAPSLASIKAAGKVIIAVDPTYPPMESEDTQGKLIGYDIDFARLVAERLGVKSDFLVMGYEGIIGGLASGRYDLIISTMNITPERSQQIDFVEYARMAQLFVAKKGLSVKSEKDLADKIVAVPTDTTSYDYIAKQQAAGVKIKDVKAFKLTSDVFMAVKTGHAEVLVVDEPVARYFAKQDAQSFAVTGRAMSPEPVGIGISKASQDLKAAVQKAVDGLRRDGTLARLDQQYFGAQLGTDAAAH
jgi:polar amino acid transport system substrate-binding protein